MEKALEILKHIEELYVAEPDLNKFERMAQKNPERVKAWDDAFKDYDLSDVLCAIDEYWNFKSSKSKPSVHHIRAMLNTKKDVEKVISNVAEEKLSDYASDFMARDIKIGCNRHILPVYQKAVRYVAEERLSEELPYDEWRNLSFAERCEKAMQKGLFNGFDDILVAICKKYYGKDYQYESKNMLGDSRARFNYQKTVENLANHFRV